MPASGQDMSGQRVLIVYYSFTQQTRTLLRHFIAGLESRGIEVTQERLYPLTPYEFPFQSTFRLIIAMVVTFFQKRMAIRPVGAQCYQSWDCIVLAGPTWSYNPSGPMLAFLDRDARDICGGAMVLPFISCRSYWYLHYWTVKRHLRRCGSTVGQPIIFSHPVKEPWRSIGLLLKLRGQIARRKFGWIRERYPQYGHSTEQRSEAMVKGRELGDRLLARL